MQRLLFHANRLPSGRSHILFYFDIYKVNITKFAAIFLIPIALPRLINRSHEPPHAPHGVHHSRFLGRRLRVDFRRQPAKEPRT